MQGQLALGMSHSKPASRARRAAAAKSRRTGVRSVGLVMANDDLMERPIADGSLVRVLRDFELPPIPISIGRPPSRTVPAAARAFAELLRRRFST